MPPISLQKTKLIDALDWLPVISTGANLVHIFAKVINTTSPVPSYGFYLRKITLLENSLLLIPIVNIFVKAFHTYRNTKSSILDSVNFNGMNLKTAPIEFTNDFDVVLAAVSENGLALQYASPLMQNNRQIVLFAMTNDKTAFQFASATLKNDLALQRQAASP